MFPPLIRVSFLTWALYWMLLTLYWVTGWLQWLFSLWLPLFWCRVTPFENKEPYARSLRSLIIFSALHWLPWRQHIEDKILTRTHVRALCTHTHSPRASAEVRICVASVYSAPCVCACVVAELPGISTLYFPTTYFCRLRAAGANCWKRELRRPGFCIFLFLFRARGANSVSRQTFLTVALCATGFKYEWMRELSWRLYANSDARHFSG